MEEHNHKRFKSLPRSLCIAYNFSNTLRMPKYMKTIKAHMRTARYKDYEFLIRSSASQVHHNSEFTLRAGPL